MTNRNKYISIFFSLIAISVATFSVFKILQKPVDPFFDAEKDIQSGDIHLISYGFAMTLPGEYNAKKKADSLENKLGFYWKDYGCIADSASNALANEYNDKIIKYLNKRNGIDWYRKYRSTVDSLYKNVK